MAHVVAIDPQRIGDAGAEIDRLVDQGRERVCLVKRQPVGEALERVLERAAGTGLEIGHVDIGGERRIAVAELAADAFERGFHRQPGIRAHHQQVHEIRKAGAVLLLAGGNTPVDVHAGADVAGDAADDHHQPKERRSVRLHHGPRHEHGGGDADGERRARDEKERDPARIVDAGLDQPPPQHLHVLVVGRGIVLGGVFDELGHHLQAGISQRALGIGLPLAFIQDV